MLLTSKGIRSALEAINGEKILPINTPKKLPEIETDIREDGRVFHPLPIAIELANERCFSENQMNENFVGINRMNVCANAHRN